MTALLIQGTAAHIPVCDDIAQCAVTSPPYFGLRKYEGVPPSIWGGDSKHEHRWGPMERGKRADLKAADQTTSSGRLGTDGRQGQAPLSGGYFCSCGAWLGMLGMEPTPDLYVEHIVECMREVRRVLRPDGTLWLVIGDSYISKQRGSDKGWDKSRLSNPGYQQNVQATALRPRPTPSAIGLKHKNLAGIPYRVALALQADGWWWRSPIVWEKPNVTPENVTDRPTINHEYIWLLATAERYFYDQKAIAESNESGASLHKANSSTNIGRKRAVGSPESRNARTVWKIATTPYTGAHFATFPPELVERCIKAGSRRDDVVLDPFVGSGTTGQVARRLGRSFVGVDMSRDYLTKLAQWRIGAALGGGRRAPPLGEAPDGALL